jgi:hypothetical protein
MFAVAGLSAARPTTIKTVDECRVVRPLKRHQRTTSSYFRLPLVAWLHFQVTAGGLVPVGPRPATTG